MVLPDLEAARVEACIRIRAVLAGEAGEGQPIENRESLITDDTGKILLRVPFADALS